MTKDTMGDCRDDSDESGASSWRSELRINQNSELNRRIHDVNNDLNSRVGNVNPRLGDLQAKTGRPVYRP